MNLAKQNLDRLPAPERASTIYYDLEGRGSMRGLGLRVTENNVRSWILNYTNRAGQRRRFTIGEYPNLTLEHARSIAGRLRDQIRNDDFDPLKDKADRRKRAKEEIEAERRVHTVAALAEQWFERHAKLHKRPLSLRDDRRMLDKFILPRFGEMKVTALSHGEIETMMAKLADTPVQANRIHALLTTLMRYAVAHHYRGDNPCAGITKYEEQPREVHVSREQLDRLYSALESHPNRQAVNAVKLAVWTGARRTEVLGAQWSEFDLERGRWRRPAVRLKQKKLSIIPLNPLALKLLREMRAADPNGVFLFPSPTLGDRARRDVRNLWADIRKETGLRKLRLHDLRHVFATTALEADVPLDTLAPLLGHASTQMSKTYAHWKDETLRAASAKIAALLAPPEAPAGPAGLPLNGNGAS